MLGLGKEVVRNHPLDRVVLREDLEVADERLRRAGQVGQPTRRTGLHRLQNRRRDAAARRIEYEQVWGNAGEHLTQQGFDPPFEEFHVGRTMAQNVDTPVAHGGRNALDGRDALGRAREKECHDPNAGVRIDHLLAAVAQRVFHDRLEREPRRRCVRLEEGCQGNLQAKPHETIRQDSRTEHRHGAPAKDDVRAIILEIPHDGDTAHRPPGRRAETRCGVAASLGEFTQPRLDPTRRDEADEDLPRARSEAQREGTDGNAAVEPRRTCVRNHPRQGLDGEAELRNDSLDTDGEFRQGGVLEAALVDVYEVVASPPEEPPFDAAAATRERIEEPVAVVMRVPRGHDRIELDASERRDRPEGLGNAGLLARALLGDRRVKPRAPAAHTEVCARLEVVLRCYRASLLPAIVHASIPPARDQTLVKPWPAR